MSFQAYLDTIEQQTGRTPQELVDEAEDRGLTAHAEIVAWAKDELGLGTGHARALAHVVRHGAHFELRHTTGTHRDASGLLDLAGMARRSAAPSARARVAR